jgi:hypothetical protein
MSTMAKHDETKINTKEEFDAALDIIEKEFERNASEHRAALQRLKERLEFDD